MTASVDVIADWPDEREVVLHIWIQTNMGQPVPEVEQPEPKVEPTKDKPAGGDVDVEVDFARVPDVVHPIDEAVLDTNRVWIAFLEDATRGDQSPVYGICLRADYPLLLKRLGDTGDDRDPAHVKVGKA